MEKGACVARRRVPTKTCCPTALHSHVPSASAGKGPQPPDTAGPVGQGLMLSPGALQECLPEAPCGF